MTADVPRAHHNRMAPRGQKEDSLPTLKNLFVPNYGKLSNEQHKVLSSGFVQVFAFLFGTCCKIWIIFSKALQDMVRPHIDSFNFMLDEGLQQAVQVRLRLWDLLDQSLDLVSGTRDDDSGCSWKWTSTWGGGWGEDVTLCTRVIVSHKRGTTSCKTYVKRPEISFDLV